MQRVIYPKNNNEILMVAISEPRSVKCSSIICVFSLFLCLSVCLTTHTYAPTRSWEMKNPHARLQEKQVYSFIDKLYWS